MGADCTKGPDGGIWKTQDVDMKDALILQENHMKYAHQATMAMAHKCDGAQQRPLMIPEHLNMNKGVQGGNFVKSSLNHPIFNFQSPRGTLCSDNYQRIEMIGRGTFGEAWKVQAKHLNTSQVFVMKEISCRQQDYNAGKNEIKMLKMCRHESIVSYVEDFYEENKILIIMEFCSGGDLAEFIDKQQHLLPVDFITKWCKQLTSGLCLIHKMKIIHRDLKPANIFLTTDKKLKIGDFGIAKGLDKTSGLVSTFAGTALYIAPEIHGGEKYSRMADLWALGVIFFEIITLTKPFHGKGFLQAISKGKL